MKKYLSVLAALFALSLLAGCRPDQFAIERHYYWAQKDAQRIYKNPNAVPPFELERAVGRFGQFSKKYPKSYLAVDAEFTVARLYMVTKNYDTARRQLKKIMATYEKFEPICAEALYMTGNTYELQDKWEQALTQYKKIEQDYSATARGLEMPIYITQHYKIKYQPDRMMEAGREAVAYYKGLAARYSDKPAIAVRAEMLVVESYGLIKEWSSAAGALRAIIDKYKKKAPMDRAMMNLAILYAGRLNDKAKAKETLQELIREYPKSKLVSPAKRIIQKWTP